MLIRKFRIRIILVILLSLIAISLIYLFFIYRPSNFRDWEFGMEHPAHITINNNLINISNLRDFHYTENAQTSNYLDRTYNPNNLTQVWFVIEPFTKFKQVAHTYFVFDFSDQPPLVVSVEARREKNEDFNLLSGTLNQYELIYIWGTEIDQTSRRVIIENNSLYMYPLLITSSSAKALLLQLAHTTQQLETHPRFYNTFFSNCTNELAKAANSVKPGSIPWNLALIFPGYSADELYKLGFIPHDKPLSEINQQYFISDLVRKYYSDPNFSTLLRHQLPKQD